VTALVKIYVCPTDLKNAYDNIITYITVT